MAASITLTIEEWKELRAAIADAQAALRLDRPRDWLEAVREAESHLMLAQRIVAI